MQISVQTNTVRVKAMVSPSDQNVNGALSIKFRSPGLSNLRPPLWGGPALGSRLKIQDTPTVYDNVS
jgi:hypothetical protein